MNKAIGESSIELDDKEYVLTPSFEALTEIERTSDRSIVDMFNDFSRKKSSARASDMVVVIYCCLNDLELKDKGLTHVSKLVRKHVISKYFTVAFGLLCVLIHPDEEGSKKNEEPSEPKKKVK